jgi:hypothetical protein
MRKKPAQPMPPVQSTMATVNNMNNAVRRLDAQLIEAHRRASELHEKAEQLHKRIDALKRKTGRRSSTENDGTSRVN